jgi:hypothetical protein
MNPEEFLRWKGDRHRKQAQLKQRMPGLKKRKGPALDQAAADLHAETFSRLDCLACAQCCKTIPPMVNKTDAARIARHLRLSEAAFYEQYLRRDEDGDTVMNASPCPFLETDNRCSIYEIRPKACRAYPHTDQDFSKNLDLHLRNVAYCPAVYQIMERLAGLG